MNKWSKGIQRTQELLDSIDIASYLTPNAKLKDIKFMIAGDLELAVSKEFDLFPFGLWTYWDTDRLVDYIQKKYHVKLAIETEYYVLKDYEGTK